MAIRAIDAGDGRRRLIAKRMLSDGALCRSHHECSVDRMLTAAEQERLETAEALLMRRAPFGCSNAPDGSAWLVEASGPEGYRAWHSGSPPDPDVERLSNVTMNLTGWWPEEPLPPA